MKFPSCFAQRKLSYFSVFAISLEGRCNKMNVEGGYAACTRSFSRRICSDSGLVPRSSCTFSRKTETILHIELASGSVWTSFLSCCMEQESRLDHLFEIAFLLTCLQRER